ncbi:MAG: hypothetical protein LKF15_07415 [Lachnospiraceae bacterium]|nr:hypothetical protein [Lachnospiraceae bacterium]MCH4112654.1 hypothetical protein [Lachnospiraceae bacterium]
MAPAEIFTGIPGMTDAIKPFSPGRLPNLPLSGHPAWIRGNICRLSGYDGRDQAFCTRPASEFATCRSSCMDTRKYLPSFWVWRTQSSLFHPAGFRICRFPVILHGYAEIFAGIPGMADAIKPFAPAVIKKPLPEASQAVVSRKKQIIFCKLCPFNLTILTGGVKES